MAEKPEFGVWTAKKVPAARRLRRDMTGVERLLWSELRSRDLLGRQHPLGVYVADFACVEGRLIVELDGGQHARQVAYDEERSRALLRLGFRVLRFWNNDVIENLDGVLDTIAAALPSPALREREGTHRISDGEGEGQRASPSPSSGSAQHPGPHPDPLPQGGRGR